MCACRRFCFSLRDCFFFPLTPLLPMIIIIDLLRGFSRFVEPNFPALASSRYRRYLLLVVCLCLLARTEYVALRYERRRMKRQSFWRLRGMRTSCHTLPPCHYLPLALRLHTGHSGRL
jgi:hypothetical protein